MTATPAAPQSEPERVPIAPEVYQQQRDRAQAQAAEWEATATMLRVQRDDALAQVAGLQAALDQANGHNPDPAVPGPQPEENPA